MSGRVPPQLRRGVPLRRRRPLCAVHGLRRKTPLRRRTRLCGRHRGIPRAVWRGVLQRYGRCVITGETTNLEPHHLVPRSRGGLDVVDNLVPVVRSAHRLLHDRPELGEELRLRFGGGVQGNNVYARQPIGGVLPGARCVVGVSRWRKQQGKGGCAA